MKTNMKILIDNGHGTNTRGKRSPDGRLIEALYCREIAVRVEHELCRRGYETYRLVREEDDIPLSERCRRANDICAKYGSQNTLLISIHCNAAGNGTQWMQARGWEAWTSIGHTNADKLAECLYTSAERMLPGMKLRKDLSDGDPDKESGFYILKHTVCPAVLTENLFQDNKEDVAFLLSEKGKQAITGLHVEGIIKYIES